MQDIREDERELPGGGIVHDRRTPEERSATVAFIVATDRFMSGWGRAPGRSYFAVPVLQGQDACVIEDNMRNRSEMMRVRYVAANWRPKLHDGDHLSINRGGDPWTTPGWFAAQACRRRNEELAQR